MKLLIGTLKFKFTNLTRQSIKTAFRNLAESYKLIEFVYVIKKETFLSLSLWHLHFDITYVQTSQPQNTANREADVKKI